MLFFAGFTNAAQFEKTQNIPFNNPLDVFPVDFESDGDMDLLAVSSDNVVALFRNDGNENFEKIVIDGNFDGARTVRGEDIDDDGDIDIAAAGWRSGDIKWYKNEGGVTFTKIVIDDNFPGAHTVQLYDYDKDGDIDVLCSGFDFTNKMGEVAWYENDGSENFTKHLVSERFEMSTFIDTVDFNSDGKLDIIACCESLGEIYWWRNEGNGSFTEIPFSTTYQQPHTILPRDFDNDGDSDIFGASYYGGVLAIWENLGNENFNQTNIDTITGSLWFDMADFDMDGDNDLFATGTQGAFWYKNNNGTFVKTKLPGGFNDGYCIRAVDIDGDKDLDLVGAGRAFNNLAIWYNNFYNVDFSSGLKTGHAPLEINFNNLTIQAEEPTLFAWDFCNDGSIESNEKNPVYTFLQPGVYSVKLSASTNYYDGTSVKEDYIHVFNGESSLLFEQESGYAEIVGLPALTDNFTLEFYISPDMKGLLFPGSCLYDNGNFKISLQGGGLGIKKNSFAITLTDSLGDEFVYLSDENTYMLNEWQHVAVTFNSGELELYRNGDNKVLTPKSGSEITLPLGSSINNNLIIGKSLNKEKGFSGGFDELRIWSIARVAEEIREFINFPITGNEEHLLSSYKMDEGNGILLNDIKNISSGQITDAQFSFGVDRGDIILHAEEKSSGAPDIFTLEQNYPNPFNPGTRIKFTLPENEKVVLEVYNVLGEKVTTLVDQSLNAGLHEVKFDASSGISTGVYIYRLQAGDFTSVRKMILIK